MSRVGKKAIEIPEKTQVSITDGIFNVKGPLGELSRNFSKDILIKIEDGKVVLSPVRENLFLNSLWGTYASHIGNMISGVNKLFEKKLIIEGIGYKAEVKGDKIVFNLGFSHTINISIPKTLKVTSEKNVMTISGTDKEEVGQFVAKIRSLKKPEPYKGKGIRYSDEVVRRKQGKKTT